MKRVIGGKSYDTDTAKEICELPCSFYKGDFQYHSTSLYRTLRGAYFLAGEGGPMSMWAKPVGSNGHSGGSGLCVIDADEAREHAERAGLSAEEMVAAGFEIEEG